MSAQLVRKFRSLLRRVPDDVILSVGVRDLNLSDYKSCLCSWFVREEIALLHGKNADDTIADGFDANRHWVTPYKRCADLFGGDAETWRALFNGVDPFDGSHDSLAPSIELAFVDRVAEAAGVR